VQHGSVHHARPDGWKKISQIQNALMIVSQPKLMSYYQTKDEGGNTCCLKQQLVFEKQGCLKG